MKQILVVSLTFLFLGTAAMAAVQDQPVSFDAKRATIYKAEHGSLTGPAAGTAAERILDFLRQQGLSAATVDSLRTVAEYRSPVTGLTHVHMQQEVGGLKLAGAYVRGAVTERGEVVHVIQNVGRITGTPTAAGASEVQALRVALDKLYPGNGQRPAVIGKHGNVTTFARTEFFYSSPKVERVAVLMTSGALKSGFLVETWRERGNLLHHTLVDGAGQVVSVELRTNTDSYNVFTVDPGTTPQAVLAGPGASNAQSPSGWLFSGPQNTINIAGNNVNAYLDAKSNNRPDSGGTTVTNGNFLTAADLTVTPSTSGNREVAVQNLFYLNNVIHDTLYEHGFTEAAGNFQEDNFGKGGQGSDSVNAEAQDGGGTDNANFATPTDGSNPRMQMYLWTGKGTYQVAVNSPSTALYRAEGAEFGRALDTTGITGDVVLVNDGTGTTSDGCEPITNIISGKIALIDRGNCTFVVKVANAQAAGAVAAIVANNAGDSIITMGGTDRSIRISSVFIGRTDGATLKAMSSPNATERKTDPPPIQRDGDVDSDVVWHEYGHGLTWRMIGGMSGPLAGAIGEGMSDTLSVIINENDVVGEYSFDDPIGIRRYPYTNYPLTYGDVTGAEVHNDGEIYGAIGWQMFLNYQDKRISKGELLDTLIDGMNFTPATPSYEDMRDGILESVANSADPGRACLVWSAFAKYGVGIGASGVVTTSGRTTTVTITESFTLPPDCKAK